MPPAVVTNGHADPGSDPDPPLQGNVSEGRWIVQKFGGTSIGKFASNIAQDIVRTTLSHHRVAVVCSARSSHSKLEGTTNRLLRAAREAQDPSCRHHETIVEAIREDHMAAAHASIKSHAIVTRLDAEVRHECEDLLVFLEATRVGDKMEGTTRSSTADAHVVQRVGEISSRSKDKIVAKGEKLSCRFITALLQDRGVDAQYVDLSDVIALHAPQELDQAFYEALASTLAHEVLACRHRVPVITGFFGGVPGGLLEKIGRGYTDLCAALVAVGMQAEELQVWKEVDGIFTADPRKVPTARLLTSITPAEAAELTFYGSEVIHPFTMEQVVRASIPIRIKNVMRPRGNGTVIFPDATPEFKSDASPLEIPLIRPRSARGLRQQWTKRPTAVTIKHQILVINVHSNKRSLSHGFFANIFSTLDKWRLSVDLISTSEVHVSMALHSESALLSGGGETEEQTLNHDLRGAIGELRDYGTVDVIPGMAILSLVGKQMKNMMGIAGRMFSTLGEHNVNIEMISQGALLVSLPPAIATLTPGLRLLSGASEINISCVIEERDADRAINILHTDLFTLLD
ncbi:MAG: Aspartokinase [Thelocarpon superellum]|nr:MAG: Aspartokinase [Thelocarpon superellum]